MSRVLVTGGAGFIGSHLCRKLLEQGHSVVCLDNFFTGSKENVFELMDTKYFEIVRHDIIKPILLEVDQIYNLACPASPVHYQTNPVKTIKTNVTGTINMLGLAKRLSIPILQASTSEVYGDPLVHPQKEEYWGNTNPIGVRSCYDEGKRVAESLMINYYLQNRVKIKIVRIFNTYGPNMALNDGRVISNFIIQALLGQEITVYGDGSQTRSFCYIDDLVRGLISMMGSDNGFTGPVNMGNPLEMTVLEVAQTIIKMIGSKSKIKFIPLPEDDPVKRCPDITLAKNKLNWTPRIAFEEGLGKTIEYFDSKLRKGTNI